MNIQKDLLSLYDSIDLIRTPLPYMISNVEVVTFSIFFEQAIHFCIDSGFEKNIPNFTIVDIYIDSISQNLKKIMDRYDIVLHGKSELHLLNSKSIYVYIPPHNIYEKYSFLSISKILYYFGVKRFNYNISATSLYYKIPLLPRNVLNTKKCVKVFSKLADLSSKECFLRTLKARIENNPGFISLSPFPQYQHPCVHVTNGNHVIDGGVLNGRSTEIFARQTGPSGSVIGFEAFPKFAAQSAEYLNIYPWVRIEPFGLFSDKKLMNIHEANDPGGTRITVTKSNNDIQIQTVKLDDFIINNKIDLLKLDIEGSEMDCLYGCKNLLKKNLPKLQISIYHKNDDLFNIPIYIMDNFSNYIFYIGHHSFYFNETIIYAIQSNSNNIDLLPTNIHNTNEIYGKNVLYFGSGTAYSLLKDSYTNCTAKAIVVDKIYADNMPEHIDGIKVKTFDKITNEERYLPIVIFSTHDNQYVMLRRICTQLHISEEKIHIAALTTC